MPFCNEESCTEQPQDFVRIALQTQDSGIQGLLGTMVVEVALCSLHITHMEMGTSGSFLFLRPMRETWKAPDD